MTTPCSKEKEKKQKKNPPTDPFFPSPGMMPEDSVYGPWPRSGEIDIMESRGNSRNYPEGGRNYYYGTLHWGKNGKPPTPRDSSMKLTR